MKMPTWVVMGALLLVHLQLSSCQDPCHNYQLMDMHDGRRESDYQPLSTDPLICDRDGFNPTQWVRFSRENLSYNMTNTQCVVANHCGTVGPMWMSHLSSHPTVVGTQVTTSTCINYNDGGVCACSAFGMMTVRLCQDSMNETYYVYELPWPPGCHTGFCVEPVSGSCPPNYGRTDGPDSECTLLYPPHRRPSLSGPFQRSCAFLFECYVDYTGDDDMRPDARFDVNFLSDGEKIHSVMTDADMIAALGESYLEGHFGGELTCSSSSYWTSSVDMKGHEFESSNGYFVVVQPDLYRIELEEGETGTSQLVSTVPVTCKGKTCRACTQVVGDGLALQEQCEFCFKPSDWNETAKRAYGPKLQVKVVTNVRLDPPTVYIIEFGPFFYRHPDGSINNNDTTWTGYTMNAITVAFTDSKYGVCRSTGDPHITSFDGKYYHVYDIGEFLMFQSDSPRLFEVHVRHWLCRSSRGVSCNCAVAVREGNAVLGVDMCGSSTQSSVGRPKIKQYSKSLPSGAYVTTDLKDTYYINMPSGAYVKCEMRVDTWEGVTSHYMDVYVHTVPEDRNVESLTPGFCGNFDGDPETDLRIRGTTVLDPTNSNPSSSRIPRDFSESYRIPYGQSFFDMDPESLWIDNLPDPDVPKCHCAEHGHITCSSQGDVTQHVHTSTYPDRVEPLQPASTENGERRRKGDVSRFSDDVDDEEPPEFDYGNEFIPDTEFTWPTISGITEAEARGLCQDALDALSYKDDCVTLTGVNVEETITECMEDIKIMDDTGMAGGSTGSFQTTCEFLALQDADLYTEDEDGQLQPPMEIIGQMCPSDCSGRGNCVDGICQCDSGCLGADCGLQEGTPPVLHYIPGSGRCDLTLRPCKKFRLVASGFIKTDELTCRVIELGSEAVAGDNPVIQNQTVVSITEGNATFITSAEISCKLPDIASQDSAYYELRFDFSYDGLQYSNELDMTVFDGECLSCDNECGNPDSWVMLPDTCVIDGRCAVAGHFINITGGCVTCDPSQSIDSWTPVEAELCVPTTTSPPSTQSPTPTSTSTSSTSPPTTTTSRTTSTTSTSTTTLKPQPRPPADSAAGKTPTGNADDLPTTLVAVLAAAAVLIAVSQ